MIGYTRYIHVEELPTPEWQTDVEDAAGWHTRWSPSSPRWYLITNA